MRLSSYPARPCLPSIKVVVLSSTPHFDLSRLSRYPARQASQVRPSPNPRPCLSVCPFVWPPSLRQAYCVSFSVCVVVVVAYASWATHKISTHFSSPLAFRIHISLAAFCFAVCGYRLAVRRGRSSAWSKGGRQTTTAANPSHSPCPPLLLALPCSSSRPCASSFVALVSGSSPGCASMRMLKDYYLLALDPRGDFLVRKARAQFIQFRIFQAKRF